MGNVEGPGGAEPAPISRHDKMLYEQEYRRGVDLFQRALDEYGKAEEIHKKEAFREVMDRAMQVLNETARELKRADLQNQNQKIEQSYEAFQENENASNLTQNLQKAKKEIG
jgi:predicted nucleic acid-binding protein